MQPVIDPTDSPPPREPGSPEPEAPRPLGAPLGQLFGWSLVALANGLLISILLPLPAGGARVRVVHHWVSAGHVVALGFVSYWVVRAASRLLPSRWWARLPAVFIVGAGVAALTTGEDLTTFIAKQTAAGSTVPWRLVFSLAIGAAITLISALGALLSRPWIRWLPVLVGAALAGANHHVLPAAYPAFHFFVAWCAALFAGAALTTLRRPKWRPRPRLSRLSRLGTPLIAILTIIAVSTVVMQPPDIVWRELWWSPTAILVPAIARFRAVVWIDDGKHPLAGSPWLKDRSSLPDIPPSEPPLYLAPPHVVFITVDAMRADLFAGKAHAKELPNLTALRDESLYFTKAVSPTPSTVTTLTSFLTGKYYSQIYWSAIETGAYKGYIMPHADPSPRLPELLRPAGVRSTHIVGLSGLVAEVGVGVGFEEQVIARRNYPPAREMMEHAMTRLRKADAEPVFLYMHMLDPHAPYDRGGSGGSVFDNYVEEVALVDAQIGRLRAFLREEGLEDRTILIVSADHGEAFGEHGLVYHATSVYEEMIRVPLFIRAPGVAPRKINEPVTLMDIGPTLLDLYGLPTPATFLGESLLPYLRGETPTFTRPIAVDAGRRIQAFYYPDGMKAVMDLQKATVELYNLKRDPAEKKNEVDTTGARGRSYVNGLRAFFKNHTLDRPGYTPPFRQF